MKSAKSVKSMKSVRSLKSFRSTTEDYEHYYSYVFEDFYPSICVRFECPMPVIVRKEQAQHEALMKMFLKPSQVRMRSKRFEASQFQHETQTVMEQSPPEFQEVDKSIIQVVSIYDSLNHLTEVVFTKLEKIPRSLIQCLAVVAPAFDFLTKVSITRSTLNPPIISDLNKMVRTTHITDICLNGCILHEANYSQLLEQACNLKNLSLSRCSINDEVCKQIFSYLHYPLPMEGRLLVIDLASNRITDVGAKSISDALRSNRTLRHLNIAGNYITDTGAAYIFNVLRQFPLTYDEVCSSKQRYMKYLKTRTALYTQYLQDLSGKTPEPESQKKVLTKKRKTSSSSVMSGYKGKDKSPCSNTLDFSKTKAGVMASETMGPFLDPFSSSAVVIYKEWTFCTGNFTLCYLNLAYNSLTFTTVLLLEKVLIHQNTYAKLNQPGMLKINIDGNRMPYECAEMNSLAILLNKNISRFSGKRDDSGRRKSRTLALSAGPTQKTKAP